MKISREERLIQRGPFANSAAWLKIRKSVLSAIMSIDWPVGSGKFILYPQSGKKSGEGNGVKPIKLGLMERLRIQGWTIEHDAVLGTARCPGNYDAFIETTAGPVVLEWETGNISSSHRSLNKMTLALAKGRIIGGILVVPTRAMYRFLTDRVGNMQELEPYLEFWPMVPIKNGVLEIVAIEHDGTSLDVPRIPKGTDGRARI